MILFESCSGMYGTAGKNSILEIDRERKRGTEKLRHEERLTEMAFKFCFYIPSHYIPSFATCLVIVECVI